MPCATYPGRHLVKAGESAGVLDTILDEIASYKERIESIKGKIKKALYYPIAVVGVAILVSAILLIYVIPQFEDIVASFGAALPAFTQAVIEVSRWLRSNGLYVLFAAIVFITAFIFAQKRSKPFAHFIDRISLKILIKLSK